MGGVGIFLVGLKFNGKWFWDCRDLFLDIFLCDDRLVVFGFCMMRVLDVDWFVMWLFDILFMLLMLGDLLIVDKCDLDLGMLGEFGEILRGGEFGIVVVDSCGDDVVWRIL